MANDASGDIPLCVDLVAAVLQTLAISLLLARVGFRASFFSGMMKR